MDSEKASNDSKSNTSDLGFLLCYEPTLTTSTGIWLGDRPLHYSIPLLLLQISLIFFATRVTHAVLRHLGQPQIISHIIAGILLGPSLLSHNHTIQTLLFPPRSYIVLDVVGLFAFCLFIFAVGVKIDIHIVRKPGKKVMTIALASTFIPFVASVVAGFLFLPPPISPESGELFGLIFPLSILWSATSNIVLICLLDEFNLVNSKLGRMAMSASLISDFLHMAVQSVASAIIVGAGTRSVAMGWWALMSFVGFLGLIGLVARPVTVWMIRKTPEGGTMDEAYVLVVMLMAIGCGLAGEMIGQTATTGPLLLGLVLPGGPPLGTTVVERLERVVTGLFLPVYMATTGLRTNLHELVEPSKYKFVAFVIGTSVTAKFVGLLALCTLYCKMPFRDSVVVSLMMSCKGFLEISVLGVWLDSKVIDKETYAMNILCVVAAGGLSAALLKFVNRANSHFVTHRRRTIQGSLRTAELRLLSCVHSPDDVPPVLTLLEISHPSHQSPLCLYLLHLIPLAGRAAATLVPYKKKRRHRSSFKSTTSSSLSDSIVKAFQYLETTYIGRLSVQPFVGTSPYATMHDDVCSLALDKRVVLITLPFHKRTDTGGGGIHYTNPSIRALNINVLRYAPCSVAILVDHGLSTVSACAIGGNVLHHVAVLFLGGPDDREVLALAMRIAENSAVGLTVVRFVLPEAARGEGRGEEEMVDDEVVWEFRDGVVDGERVVYREEVVVDGAGTAEVARGMCEDYGLFIVGRREGKESPLTAGLEQWSECPELGVIGDLLASADFGGKVSTLVVQQQVSLGQREIEDTVRLPGIGEGVQQKGGGYGDDDEEEEEEMENVLMQGQRSHMIPSSKH